MTVDRARNYCLCPFVGIFRYSLSLRNVEELLELQHPAICRRGAGCDGVRILWEESGTSPQAKIEARDVLVFKMMVLSQGAATIPLPTIAPEQDAGERSWSVPLFRVVLVDDSDHTYDYVIEMLQKIFVFTVDQAFRHAEEVDRCGRTVLITCELAQAEFARDQIQNYGPDWRLAQSKGSMSAFVEPAG